MRLFLGKTSQISPLFSQESEKWHLLQCGEHLPVIADSRLFKKQSYLPGCFPYQQLPNPTPPPLEKALFQFQLLYSTTVPHDIAVEADKLPQFLTEFLNL